MSSWIDEQKHWCPAGLLYHQSIQEITIRSTENSYSQVTGMFLLGMYVNEQIIVRIFPYRVSSLCLEAGIEIQERGVTGQFIRQ